MGSIWSVAKEIEFLSRKMYERMARTAAFKGLAGVYAAMARDEYRHWECIDRMQRGLPLDSPVPARAQDDPARTFEDLPALLRASADSTQLMQEAAQRHDWTLALEQRSVAHYAEIRRELGTESCRAAVDQIVSEEQQHGRILQGLLALAHEPAPITAASDLLHGAMVGQESLVCLAQP